MSKATSQAFSSYRRNRTVLSFRERYRLTVFVSNGTVAVMAQRGVSLKSVLTCYEKNKMIFFFIWAVIDFLTINISWFLLNIKQHPSPISRKPQTVFNVWMAWIVCIVLFSYHKCACPMSRAIAATFWPRGRRALRARRPRGPNVKKHFAISEVIWNKMTAIYRDCTVLTTNILYLAHEVGAWFVLYLRVRSPPPLISLSKSNGIYEHILDRVFTYINRGYPAKSAVFNSCIHACVVNHENINQ